MNDLPIKHWKNNWVANWGFLLCSLYAPIYPVVTKKLLGKGIKYAVLVNIPPTSSNYLPSKGLKVFGEFLANKVKADPHVVKIWCQQVIRQTDKFNLLLKKLKNQKNYSLADFKKFEASMWAHVPPNLAIKKVPDYLPKHLLSKYLSDFEHARIYTEEIYNQVDKIGQRIQKFIAKMTGLKQERALFLTKEDIQNYLVGGNLPKISLLNARSKGNIFLCTESGHTILTGRTAKAWLKKLEAKSTVDLLKGQIAFPGIAKGRIRIVFNPNSVKDFKLGDILVTGMTRPEFLPLMKKAAAFVTDAGGMLSHAAITAREMKKPSVIGTQIATRILKDGDMVEVDADKGVVRLVKAKARRVRKL